MLSGSSQVPRVHVAPHAATSDADLAAAFAAAYGLEPDEWQRNVLEDWLGLKAGKWTSLTCGISVPRQNGKNALLEIRELYGMVALGEKILHTAHEVKTAQKHFRRLKYFFGQKANDEGAQFPELNALVRQVRSVNGQEAIFLTNGGAIELVARSKNSGRGFTVDVLVMDEAQELSEDALEALMPTTSAAPLENPQWIFAGTPPGPSAIGEVFTRVRLEALSERPGRLCWHEWSVEGKVDLDDRTCWRMTNPALDAGRLQEPVIEGERARFSDDGFARERLGRWPEQAQGSRLISSLVWSNSGLTEPPQEGVRSFGVAFSRDGSRMSVAGCLRHEAGFHVEIVDFFEGDVDEGIAALADWLAERKDVTAQVVMSGNAGAPVLYQSLRDRGVPKPMLLVVSTLQYRTACATFLDGMKDGSVTHSAIEGQARLDESVAVCDKKTVPGGGWGWQATTADGDETPVEAVSLAVYGAKTTRRKPGRKARVMI